MTQNLIIAGYREPILQVFANQLQSMFGNDIDAKLIVAGTPISGQFSNDSIVLIQSYDIFDKIRSCIANKNNIIFISTALQTAGLARIARLPKNSTATVAGDSMEVALELTKTLARSGVKHLNLQPAQLSQQQAFQGKTVIVSGIPEEEIPGSDRIIDIFEPVLDVSTILDVGVKLERKDILVNKNITQDFLDCKVVNEGITWALERSNILNTLVRVLLDVIDGTVISVKQTGRVRACNDRMETVFGLKREDVLGQNGITLFPEIPFREILQGKSPMIECLKKIRDENMVLTVKPLFNSGKRYGAVAVLKRFDDEENKQHKFRTLLMGKGYRARYQFDDIIGESAAMTHCKSIAMRMAHSDSSILITGETGTGKEMLAQAIHNASIRRQYQFVAVNCGAIPENLLESELFGYEEGAFTGARKGGKPGFFELAHKGTLFLDEISEMPQNLQSRLLRALQEREVTRLGGDSVIHVDVRIIAVTNRSLEDLSKAGGFRPDLYYRLNVLPLNLPPLRKRSEDIRILAASFQKKLNSTFDLTEEVWRELEQYSWPGNVRELRNYIEYFANLSRPVIGIREMLQVVPIYAYGAAENLAEPGRVVRTEDWKMEAQNVLVLSILKEGLEKKQRMGRRSISRLAGERGAFLGEQEVRRILTALAQQGLVVINQTKAGTVISAKGLAALSAEHLCI